MAEHIELRASSLGEIGDCSRRAAAKILRDELKERYGLADSRQSVGAAIGTTLHALMAELFRTKLSLGWIGQEHINDAMESVWPTFEKEIENGVIWDAKGPTQHEDIAREQLRNMALAFLPVATYVNPARIEHKYEYLISPLGTQAVPVLLTGHVDVLDTRGEIQDHKTGKEFPAAHAQLGAYAILGRYNDEDINAVRINFVPRKPISKQNEVVARSVRLPLDECIASAWSVIKDFQRHYMEWLESKDRGEPDPHAFTANPISYLCTRNICPAFGTHWCGVGNTLSEEG